jgi:hypothetical protein
MTDACKVNFKDSIKEMPNLKMIVLLGNDSYKAVTGQSTVKMKSVYLQPFKLEEYGEIYFVPIPHPASLLYNPTPEANAKFYDGVKSCFELLKAYKKVTKQRRFIYILDSEKLVRALDILKKHKFLSIDTETTGLKFYSSEMLCFAISFEDSTAIAFPWKWGVDSLDYFWNEKDRELIIQTFSEFFFDPNKGFTAHNSKFDSLIFREEFGYPIENIRFDTMNAAFLLDSNKPSDLDSVVLRELPENVGYKKSFWIDVSESEKEAGTWWKKKKLDDVLEYCCEDASNTFTLSKILAGKL